MSHAYRTYVEHPSAWRGPDLGSIDDVSFVLGDRHVTALEGALASVRETGLTVDTIERDDFDVSEIAGDLADIEAEILHGKGIVVLRGFPVEGHSLDDIEIMYWGLGCHLGTGESQSNMGDRLGHVKDVAGKDRSERAYRNSVELMMHTDLTDIIGMLSIRKAPRGGLSTYVSAAAIHNEILSTRPEFLEPLYRGFQYHRFGAEGPGEGPVTPHRVPVLSEQDGHLSVRYVPDYIYMAAAELGEPIADDDLAALDYFNELAMRPDLRLDVMMEPGDLSFINNYTVLHTRDAFYDGDDESEKRLLLRLWLSSDYERPTVDTLSIFDEPGIAALAGKGTYYSGPTDPESQLGPDGP